ncbi:TPA: hypothetical protein DCL22_01550, partial [Candidatus Moranbacteria bacterium]|nr:hypothetical protein [Candidatus Moranbacteria bacterium]
EITGTLPVEYGGTETTSLTDGGVLLGSGVGAITPMGVLNDGSIIIGDGVTDPTILAAFTSSTGALKHEYGGLEADVSAYSGLIKISGGATSSITDNSSNWDTAYTHSQDNTQAHSDYLINNGDDTTSGRITAAGFTTNIQNGFQFNPYDTGAGDTGEIRFLELAANGTSYIGFKSPDAITSSYIWTLPGAEGTPNNVLITDGSGNLSWSTVSGVGGMNSFTLAGDSGVNQTIDDADILTIAGGTNIATIGSATDTLTINLDSTLTGTTWNGNAIGVGYGGTGVATEGDLEDKIEAYIFDADGESISGIWTVADNINFRFGTDGDIVFAYDAVTDNRLEFTDGTNLLGALFDAGTVGNLFVSGGISTYDSTVADGYGEFTGLCLGNGTECITTWSGTQAITGSGSAGYATYWVDASTLGSEPQLATSRGGTGIDTASSSGVPFVIGGLWSTTGTASQGDILYYNGSAWTELSAGVSGQYLKTQGAAANPTWADVSTGVTDHGALTGLTGTDHHTQYALLAGRASGQTLIGGTGTTDDLILQTTSATGIAGANMYFKVGDNGATTAMTILNSGYVGIGTTAPDVKLYVDGDIKANATSWGYMYPEIRMSNSAGPAVNAGTSIDFSAYRMGGLSTITGRIGSFISDISSSYKGVLVFYTANGATADEKMRIDNAGSVGIGTTNPTSLFSVGATSQFQVDASGQVVAGSWLGTAIGAQYGGTGIATNGSTGVPTISGGTWSVDTNYLALAHGGTNASLTASNGGIVYSTASELAVLSANANSGLALVSGGAGAPTWFAPTQGSMLFAGANGALAQDNANFFWNNTSKYLGIGTTAPASQFEVYNGGASPIITLTGAHDTDYDPMIQFRTDATPTVKFSMGVDAADDSFKIYSGDGIGGTSEFSIDTDGTVSIANMELGVFDFADNAGAVSWVDMSVTSAATPAGTVESYTAQLDGNAMLTIYGESDAAGGTQNRGIGIGVTSPTALLHIAGGTTTQPPLKLTSGTNLTTAEAGAMEF